MLVLVIPALLAAIHGWPLCNNTMAATDLTSTTSASAAASSAGIGASSLDDCPVTVTAASTPNNVVITFPHVVVPGVPRATILHVKVAHVEDMVAACWSFANLLGSQEVKVETIDPNTATPLVSNSYYVIDKGQPPRESPKGQSDLLTDTASTAFPDARGHVDRMHASNKSVQVLHIVQLGP